MDRSLSGPRLPSWQGFSLALAVAMYHQAIRRGNNAYGQSRSIKILGLVDDGDFVDFNRI